MLITSFNRLLIKTIEAYWFAYYIHTNKLCNTKRYVPLVGFTSQLKEQSFQVYLYDTWIDFNQPGTFYIIRRIVPNSYFSDNTMQGALEKLLCFVKQSFSD